MFKECLHGSLLNSSPLVCGEGDGNIILKWVLRVF
jgi:hypothetical protein